MENRIYDRFQAHGFDCVIGRGGPCNKNFNGYMRLPSGHPWMGKSYMDIQCEVHGGLTFGDWGLPWENKPRDEYWIGFDTCHAGDTVVGSTLHTPGDKFRDAEYVRAELIQMAKQAFDAGIAFSQANSN